MNLKETIRILDNLLINHFLDNVLTTKEWEAIKNASDVMIKTHEFSTSMVTESAMSVTEFADKCRECGKAIGYSLKQMTETRTENKKPGLWLWIYDDDTGSYRCSECCGKGEPNFRFCPHCGSGMMTRLHR